MILTQVCLIPKPDYLPLYHTPHLTSSVGADCILVCPDRIQKRRKNPAKNWSEFVNHVLQIMHYVPLYHFVCKMHVIHIRKKN